MPRRRSHPRRHAGPLPGEPIGGGRAREHLAWLAGALLLAAASCDGGGAPAEPLGGGCDGRQIVLVNCSGCHDGVSETTGFLDLSQPAGIGDLVGKPAAGPKCAATGGTLINPDGSGLFIDKLRAPPPCGEQMPQGTFPLSSEETACVAAWLATVAAGS